MAALINDTPAPPTDSKAEAFAMWCLCMDTARIGEVNLGPLIVTSHHKTIWKAMVRIHMRQPGLLAGEFMVALRRDLHAVECPKPAAIMHSRPHKAGAPGCEGQRYTSLLIGVPLNELGRPLDYWIARLERVQEARALIERAQVIAERAWRLDVEGARDVVYSVAASGDPKPIWERDAG